MADILAVLEKLDQDHSEDIEHWLSQQRKHARPLFYSSVDLRHSGHKIAPVDTNLFPAGFNNLSPAARARTSRFVAQFLKEKYPSAKHVAIIPENHTRNMGYLENLSVLLSVFEANNFEVCLGSLAAESGQPITLQTPSGHTLVEYALKREGDKLVLDNGFTPDIIILNNDLTAGPPQLLQQVAQPVLPPIGLGWYVRRKSVHFAEYQKLVEDFAATFRLDPWLLNAEFHQCSVSDFKERANLECVAEGIEKVLSRVREKYKQYGITDEPYAFVKADSGTYGMGIMTVRAAEEILELNKKERNKMQVIKEGARVQEVIIQEGIPTIDTVNGKPAEPMVYMIDGIPVGGMYRVNSQRDAFNNLNASGMEFTGMCDEVEDLCGDWKTVRNCHFRSFGVLSAIAALAAAREDYSLAGSAAERAFG